MRTITVIFIVLLSVSAAFGATEPCAGEEIDTALHCPDDITPLDGNVDKANYKYCKTMGTNFILYYNYNDPNVDIAWQAKMPTANSGYSSFGLGPGGSGTWLLYIVNQADPNNFVEYIGHQTPTANGVQNNANNEACTTGGVMSCTFDRPKTGNPVDYTHETRMGIGYAVSDGGTDTTRKHSTYGSSNLVGCNPNLPKSVFGSGGGGLFDENGGLNFLLIAGAAGVAFVIVGVGIYYKKTQEQSQGAIYDHGGYASQWSGSNEGSYSSYNSSRSKGSKGSKGHGSRSRGRSHGSRSKSSHSRSKGSKSHSSRRH